MKILKTYKETIPRVKLIGKRYTNADRDESGTFSKYWQQCFRENWPATLKKCDALSGISDHMIGAMRMTDDKDGFEYWIGAFMAPTSPTPQGFESIEIPPGEVGVCWLYGNDKNGELYSIEASELCMAALAQNGWNIPQKAWFFERYNHPRFTTPDQQGNVILDVGAYLI